MTYYLDGDYRLHVASAEGLTPWADAEGMFTGKCATYIEGYRVVPAGQRWTRPDGATFTGEMVTPAVSVGLLQAAQREYERLAPER